MTRLLLGKPKLSTRYFVTCERLLFKYQKGTRMNIYIRGGKKKKNETKPGMNIQTG